jgi:uncharacterized RDD family membrane protein YckC
MAAVLYPRLIKRVRAVLIDSLIVPTAAVTSLAIGYAAGVNDVWGRILLFTAPILLLEPGLVSWTRGTVGHHIVGVQVTKTDGVSRLGFVAATVRAIVKFVLGWFSLIFVLTTEKHQAIHDLAAGSIVTHRDASRLPAYEVLPERRVESPQFAYPSRTRRTFFIVVYCFALFSVVGITAALLVSDDCADRRICGAAEALVHVALNIGLLVSTGALIVLGWNGRLPGARRRPVSGNRQPARRAD